MSHQFDGESQDTPVSAVAFEFSTNGVAVDERVEFWRATTGRRMLCSAASGAEDRVAARVRGLVGGEVEFVDYQSKAMWMDRTPRMCRSDGREEICLGFVLSAETGAFQNGRALQLQRGDLYLVDFAHPVKSLSLNHHELALMLPRARVAEAMGGDPAKFGGTRFRNSGIGTLLAAHMSTIATEHPRMARDERALAMRIAGDLAFATLRSAVGGSIHSEQFPTGLRAAALALIRQHCGDPALAPAKISALLGCSRATLYRLFARNSDSLSATIREARLARSYAMLTQADGRLFPVGEIAFRCGFLDHATFTRMFKRKYGLTPTELRATAAAVTAAPQAGKTEPVAKRT